MSEGSAVGVVSRWAIDEDETSGLLQAAAALSGVRITYRPENNEDYIADNGRIEAIYWGNVDTDVEVRAFKGGSNIKYSESAARELVVMVAAKDKDDSAADVEERAFNLLGEIVKVFQANTPTSPGAHLTNIRAYVDDWDTEIGTLARGSVRVHAVTIEISIRIEANVEQ